MKAWNIFYQNIVQIGLVKSKDKIVLSVSGGQDSICMLHMFWRLAKKMQIELLTVNFNHNLRKESIKEAEIVKNLSNKFGINCILESINVKEYSKKKSISIETSGRNLRYLLLENIAKEYKCNKISTAHNANDNAETVLMWLLRGSGNFTGIPQERNIDKKLSIIRPLLSVKRKFIEDYISTHKLPFCTDKSNFSDVYTRNKIRLSIIPLCEKINTMAIEHIFNLSRIHAIENSYLEEITFKCLKKCVKFSKRQILLDLTMFLQYNKAVQYRILKNILPHKKHNSYINLIMYKILSSHLSIHKISDKWNFCIKSNNKACFIRGG
ncbi:MAG: tRNA lysidine(34) synthetase TilS [Endomicrobium sp.]|jgi:tRNA(Ile)-lysidine synthase|nr:tRNA lysidine(34) synthetase TilS [Endomicrobium sp.]